jgi:hypothetical protein
MPRNLDYPAPMHGRMLRQRLWEAQIDAGMLYDTLRDDDAVPAWTIDKVARGAGDLHQVSRYLRFKASNPIHWGAPDTGSKATPLQIAGTMAIMALALTGVNGLIALALKSPPAAPAPKRRRRRPTYYAL